MPETSSTSVRCGQHQTQPQRDKIKKLAESPPPPPQTKDMASSAATGSQCWSSSESLPQKQQRPSVLRQLSPTASRPQYENNAGISSCKDGVYADCLSQSSSPSMGSSLSLNHNFLSVRRDSEKHSSIDTKLRDSIPEATSALFVSGLCRWPGCEAVPEDFSSFLKHLHSEHGHSDRSIAQWRVQQDIVQYMESQLILEKQKLIAMQLHLHLFEHKYTDMKAASEWQYSLHPFLPQPQVADGDRVQPRWLNYLEELSQHSYKPTGSPRLLPDLAPSIECYKYNNIRPPYTYAYLIRWSILESPDKQRTLNEIYNWFTTMFFYFRHNTATWKNAVRHNLSLHKCFVRVEGGKGAVWTVDETEYQRRKGQKYHRDCPVKWLTSYSHNCPEDP